MQNQNQSTIQNHLDLNYSDKIQTEKKIEILANGLSGNLKIEDYINLTKITITSSVDSRQKGKIPNIELVNLPKLEEVSIILCNLEELTFQNCPNVETLRLRNNNLHNLNFLIGLDQEKLTCLSIVNNNIEEQDLDYFNNFINLETLSIGNEPAPVREKRGNNLFKGSLKSLEKSTKLKELHISKTNINEGLDFLPLSIEKIYCDGKTEYLRSAGKYITRSYQCSIIEEQLNKGWKGSKLTAEKHFAIESKDIKEIKQAFDNTENILRNRFPESSIKAAQRMRNDNQREDTEIIQNATPFLQRPGTANLLAIIFGISAALVAILALLPPVITLIKDWNKKD